jgi:hypothetical protein
MNKLLPLILILSACGTESVTFLNGKDGSNGKDAPDNSAEVSSLKDRMDANESLDSLQSALLSANSVSDSALAIRVAALEAGQANMQSLLSAESAARASGDSSLADSLASQILAQEAADALLQAQIDSIQSSLSSLSSSVTSLQSDLSSISSDITVIYNELSNMYAELDDLQDALDDTSSDLQGQIDDLLDVINNLPLGTSVTASNGTCKLITGNFYMKSDKLYNENDATPCNGNDDKVNLSSSDSYQINASTLAVKVKNVILIFSF